MLPPVRKSFAAIDGRGKMNSNRGHPQRQTEQLAYGPGQQGHLERLLRAFIKDYYHLARPHHGPEGDTPMPHAEPPDISGPGKLASISVLGGLDHRYVRGPRELPNSSLHSPQRFPLIPRLVVRK